MSLSLTICRPRVFLAAILMLGAVVMIGCRSGTPTPTAAPGNAANHRQYVEMAEAAYADGDFEAAFDAAQDAVRAAPDDPTSWEWVRRSAVAMAADDYLRSLPEGRYRITVEQFLADQVNGVHYAIVDVREPDEFAEGHIEGAVNIPLRQLTRRLDELPSNPSSPILVYCHSGRRAAHALVILRLLGYMRVFNLRDGYVAYTEYLAENPTPTPGPTPTFDPALGSDQDGGC